MRKLKKSFIILAVLAVAFVITACGGSMKTDISLKTDKTGTRVMTYTANLEENAGKYNGTVDEITDAVRNGCPSDLTFQDKSTEEDVIYEFTLSFTDIDDYNAKINNILVAGGLDKVDEPVVAAAPDSIFAAGVKYYENFDADDLLAWFENLLVDNGYVEAGNKGDIIGNNNFTYNIMGVTGETSYMQVDTIKYLRLDGINVYTTINGNGTFDRKIEVLVPEASMSEKGDDIKAFMESVTVSGADGRWKQGEGQQTYIIELTGADEGKINEMMNAFCGTTGEKLFTVGESKSKASAVFADTKNINDAFRLEDYVTGSYNELYFGYYVKDCGFYEGELKLPSNTEKFSYTGRGNDSFEQIYSTYYDFDFSYNYDYTNNFDLANASIVLKPLFDGQVKRTVELTYGVEFTEEKIEEIKTKIEEAVTKANDEASISGLKSEMKLKKCEAGEGTLNVILETKAVAAEESALWNTAFGGNCTLGVAVNSKAFMPLVRYTAVEDRFDLSMFAGAEIPTVDYTIKGIGKTVPYGVTPDHQKGNNYIETFTEQAPNKIYVSVTGKKFNIIPLIVIIAAGLAACAAVAFTLMTVLKKAKEKKANAPAPAQNFAPAGMQPQMPGMNTGAPMQPVPDMGAEQFQPAPDMNAPIPPVPDVGAAQFQPAPDMNAPIPPVPDMGAAQFQPAPDMNATQPVMQPESQVEAPAKTFCTNCGQELAPGSTFCTSCGTKLG